MGLETIKNVQDLDEKERDIVSMLISVYNSKLSRNKTKQRYYEDKNQAKPLGLTVPPDFLNRVSTSVGWCAKAVDMLAARSQYDGMSLSSGDNAQLDEIMGDNDIALKYSAGVQSELVHSCGFWTVNKNDDMRSGVQIAYHDAESASGIWDYAKNRIKAGLVIMDYGYTVAGKSYPSVVHVYMDDRILVFTSNDQNNWNMTRYSNPMGRPLMEPMCYRPSNKRPFGKSRISRTAMAITDEMQREIMRTALHSELFSAPQKYLLGASEESFDKSKFSLYMDTFLLATKDEDGDLPQIGQLAQASIEPHIKVMENLMSRMAAETSCPVAAFGLSSNGYTSSDALRASTDDLIIEAEALNKTNGKALRNVALMAMAIQENKRIEELTYDQLSVAVQWKNPSMPSIASQTDAIVKQAAVVDWFPDTSVFWEELGYTEEQRRRIQSEKKSAQASAQLSAVLFGGNGGE